MGTCSCFSQTTSANSSNHIIKLKARKSSGINHNFKVPSVSDDEACAHESEYTDLDPETVQQTETIKKPPIMISFWDKSFLQHCQKIIGYWIRVGAGYTQHIAFYNLIFLVIKYVTEREHFEFYSSMTIPIDINHLKAGFGFSAINNAENAKTENVENNHGHIKTVIGAFVTTKNMMEGGAKCIWNLRFNTQIEDEYYFGIINDLDVNEIHHDFKWWEGDSFKGYGFKGKQSTDFSVQLCLDIKKGNLSYFDDKDDKNKDSSRISRHMKYRLAISFVNTVDDSSMVEIIDFDVF